MSAADVVYVHGMWMPGSEMVFVARHLEREHGFRRRLFSYRSIRATLDENAELLADFLDDDDRPVHVVGHSLGGVVALRTLAMNAPRNVSRVVCMGSPLCGSRAASRVTGHGWGKRILGKSVAQGVVDEAAAVWAGRVTEQYQVGVIAGTLAMGLGKLVTRFEAASDGTIAVSETRLPGARDHIELKVSHSGMVVSKAAAEQVAAFLKHGEFLREP